MMAPGQILVQRTHQHANINSHASFDPGKLFENPKNWTPQHLVGLNIQEHHDAVIFRNLPSHDYPCTTSPPSFEPF